MVGFLVQGGAPPDDSVATAKIQDNAVNETKLKDALIADFTEVTVAAGDSILLGDVDDSGNSKRDTVQGILDLVPAGGSQVLIGTAEASTSASLTITGLSSTYNTYLIIGDGLYGSATESVPWLRLGDSGGVDSGASDYSWVCEDDGMIANTAGTSVTAPIHNKDNADAQMKLCGASEEVGNAAGEGFAFTAYLHAAQTGQLYPCIRGQGTWMDHTSGHLHSNEFGGSRRSTITTDRVNFQWNTGTITGGRLTVWGLAHA